MKLRTSYFNTGVFRKNLTRFAPAWGLYLVFGVLITLIGAADETADWFAREIGYAMASMGMVNMVYGLIVALLLFGDLFSSRMCNALHAMPLRREGWFLTNFVSGLVFSLLPNAVITVVMLLFTGSHAHVPLAWLALMCLQYLFFFGVAVFSVFCAGNRFAAALVFGILNFLAMLAYFLLDTLFVPLLYGLQVYDELFNPFCPLVQMLSLDYADVLHQYETTVESFNGLITPGDYVLQNETYAVHILWNDFLYLLTYAAVGIALTVAALGLYRKRHLETAGDFIAVKAFKPVFLVLYALCLGALVYLFFDAFIGSDGLAFLFIGLAIGHFTGKMFLERTTRVFRGKSWLGFGILAGAVGLSLLLTALDPLGITRWVPEAERVESVAFSEETYALYSDDVYHQYTATEEQEIADLLALHRYALENLSEEHSYDDSCSVCLKYTLKSGRQVYREYRVRTDSSAGQIIREYTNTAEYILRGYFDSFDQVLPHLMDVHGDVYIAPEHYADLLAALAMDAQEGKLSPVWELYPDAQTVTWLTLCIQLPEDRELGGARVREQVYVEVVIRSSAEHTVSFLRENEYLEKYDSEIIYD